MEYDELAFFNRQLGAMLQTGIPLERALRQLCTDMRTGPFRHEMEALETELAQGTPLPEALGRRRLPRLYGQMLELGARGGTLPDTLVRLADYYQRLGSVWTRLKAMMFYPALVYGVALVLFAMIDYYYTQLRAEIFMPVRGLLAGPHGTPVEPNLVLFWLPVIWMAAVGVLAILLILLPVGRDWLRTKLPGFKEARLGEFAGTMKLLLQTGTPLPEALNLMARLEAGSLLGRDITAWRQELAAGQTKVESATAGSRVLPPLFRWILVQAGENLTTGFAEAAAIYERRAEHRVEMMLYAALPVAVLALAVVIGFQLLPAMHLITRLLSGLANP